MHMVISHSVRFALSLAVHLQVLNMYMVMSNLLLRLLQVVFSPLRCDGVGLSDGEVMERLWSYLRHFSRMTKEMRPSHRTDVLCHALIYYGYKTKEKLGKHIDTRHMVGTSFSFEMCNPTH